MSVFSIEIMLIHFFLFSSNECLLRTSLRGIVLGLMLEKKKKKVD